jgi:hypothetical protein
MEQYELGVGTRRRPSGKQDYAAAIDVEGGKLKQRAERKKKVKAHLL